MRRKFIHQSYLFAALCFGIILGTILIMIVRWNYFSSLWWLMAICLLFIYGFVRPTRVFTLIILVAGMILAFVRAAPELQSQQLISQFFNQQIELTGQILNDPETDDSETNLKLGNLMISNTRISGALFITTSKNSTLQRSDILTLSGTLASGFGTYIGTIYRATIRAVSRASPTDPALSFRNWLAARIQQLIPEPESNLGIAYLLGLRTNLPDDLDENLRVVGLTHIIVASGTHLSILVDLARKIFGRISRFAGWIFSLLFILFFMALVGWTPSILRAGIMSILSISMWYVGRKFEPWRIILIVAAITLLIDPNFIINLGWLLSFASFAGIMILGPSITRFFFGGAKPKTIASLIITTVSATLLTAPITLYFFGSISTISLVANLLILPTLPYIMGLVLITGLMVGIPFLSDIIAFCATKLLDYHIYIVEFFGAQKYFLLSIPANNPLIFLLYIPILAPFIYGWLKRQVGQFAKI